MAMLRHSGVRGRAIPQFLSIVVAFLVGAAVAFFALDMKVAPSAMRSARLVTIVQHSNRIARLVQDGTAFKTTNAAMYNANSAETKGDEDVSWNAGPEFVRVPLLKQLRFHAISWPHAICQLQLPWLYVVTPTYRRLTQKADMTRLCHTLMHVPRLHWIVVEDAASPSPLITQLLDRCKVPSITHLTAETPDSIKPAICKAVDRHHGCPSSRLGLPQDTWTHPRGVIQRNAGILFLRNLLHHREQDAHILRASSLGSAAGVVYFADDDNTYDLRLFNAMRRVERVGAWRVGLVGDLLYEGPVASAVKPGDTDAVPSLSNWRVGWRPERPFPIDMAGFAVHTSQLQANSQLLFDQQSARGHLESDFLSKLVATRQELEIVDAPWPNEVLCWHTKGMVPRTKYEATLAEAGQPAGEVEV